MESHWLVYRYDAQSVPEGNPVRVCGSNARPSDFAFLGAGNFSGFLNSKRYSCDNTAKKTEFEPGTPKNYMADGADGEIELFLG